MLNQEQREQLCAPYGIGPNNTKFGLLPNTRKGNFALYAIGVTYIIISTIRFLYYRRVRCPFYFTLPRYLPSMLLFLCLELYLLSLIPIF